MVNLFQILVGICIILIIIGIILGFSTNVKGLPIGLFLAGVIGGIAIYLCRRYDIINFD